MQRAIVQTEYLMACEQFRAKKYAEANRLFGEYLAKYPLDSRSPAILLLMNQKNVAEEKWDEAISAWRRLVSKYPGTDQASRAQYLIGATLEQKLGRLEDALEEYRKVTWGSAAGDARMAAARLTAKTMTVSTERIFRSDETPKLKLVTRNIESVTVRVYKVDLETYFRKMHLARGVEGLDISLIDPDATFEFKVPKYAKHQEIESALVVPPLGGVVSGESAKAGTTSGGVMAVTVSSKALEATTMVIQSDLDVIVKSSRDEVFVFAENMLSGKPWPGVRLLISNGHAVIGEGTTDAHGVFQKNYRDLPASASEVAVPAVDSVAPPIKTPAPSEPDPAPSERLPPPAPPAPPPVPCSVPADDPFGGVPATLPSKPAPQQAAVERRGAPLASNDIRVFAVVGNNVASNMLDLQGVGVAQGLTDKGYIYSDRPAYRAGQLVNIRGCLRRAVNDAYTVDSGKPYTVEVFDSRNRPIRQEKVKLDAFGSFHVHFILPPNSPQGQYRVLVHDNAAQNFQGTFLVHEYQLEPIRLVVDTPRRVYYRGEPIEGTIRAEFYYGAPVVGREVRYQLVGDRLQTATTDAKGEIHFNLPTREYSESQVLPLTVQLPEGNVNAQVNFVLAAQGFSIGVSTVRPVYVTGESLEATVNIRDAENKPLAQKFVLKVLERTLVEGRQGERLVEGRPAATAADGKVRLTLKIDKGGTYFLRAEATDRFRNPITGQATIEISGEDDLVRLRILADKHTYKVGDVAAVQLHWRDEPALALVTYQGARVLDYRLVELKTGVNELQIPMTANLAPNFELAVAVMTEESRGERGKGRNEKGETRGAQASNAGPGKNQIESGNKIPHSKLKFHTSTSPFTVERDLRVKIVTKPKSHHPVPEGEGTRQVRPGDELEVTVTTTDPQGKPVAAELSLAMVEQSLLERFASPLPSIEDFFRGAAREPAVRCTSSITFNYRPATQPINPMLLAEKDREEIAKEEEESRRAGLVPVVGRFAAAQQPLFGDWERADAPRINITEEAEEELGLIPGEYSVNAGQYLNDAVKSSVFSRSGATGATRGFQSPSSIAHQQRQQAGTDLPVYVQGLNLSVEFNDGSSRANELAANGIFTQDLSVPFPQGSYALAVPQSGNGFAGGEAISGEDINGLIAQKQSQVIVVDNSGMCRNVKLGNGKLDDKRAADMAAEFNASGAILLSALLPQETGYWNPAVTTGADGKATITLTVPERSTAWKFLAKGLSVDTLAGEATDDLVVKKDLFGEIKLPLAFTDGDTAEIPVTVQNDVVEKGPIEVVLRTTVDNRRVEETKTIQVTGKGIQEVRFKVELKRPEKKGGETRRHGDTENEGSAAADVQFELVVRAAGHEDLVQRSVPLHPYGVPVFTAASGSGEADATVWLTAPEGMSPESATMQILVGPTVERSLLDIVLAPAPWCQMETGRLASGLDTAASDVMASLALQKLLGGSRDAGGPEAMALESRIRGSISLLLAAQNDGGSWSWTGTPGAAADRYASCRIVWAMTLARKAGYIVPDDAYQKALGYLRNQVAATDNADYESKAILLHALAVAGQGDFALANRLYRDRNAISSAALAHLSLAFAAMDRKATTQELLGLLEKRDLDRLSTRRDAALGILPWSSSPSELRALYALAIQEVVPKSPKAKELVDWLLAHRTGNRWSPDKATGPAALALCRWFADSRFQADRYQLNVFVNDVRVKALDINASTWGSTQVIDVPRRFLAPLAEKGKQRVNFQIGGRGRYAFQCILGGFVPAEKLRSTAGSWSVERHYEPAPLELDGREIPRGFAVLVGSYQTFRNPLDQLPVGRRGMVNIELRRNVAWNTPAERLEYLVVTEPIPSGATVIEKSVSGPFEHFEIGPGEITFYVGNQFGLGTLHYELYGYLPGSYRGPDGGAQRPSARRAAGFDAEVADRAAARGRIGRSLSPHAPGALRVGQATGGQARLRRGHAPPGGAGGEMEPAAGDLQGGCRDAAGHPLGDWPAGQNRPLLRDRQGEVACRGGALRQDYEGGRSLSRDGRVRTQLPRLPRIRSRATSPARAKRPVFSSRRASSCGASRP